MIKDNIKPLNQATKEKLIMIADTYASSHRENVLHYLVTRQITIDEMPLLDNVPDTKQWLVMKMEEFFHQPDPAEEQERLKLLDKLPSSSDELKYLDEYSLKSLKEQLDNYIRKYEDILPNGNIVPKAKAFLEKIYFLEEENEWNSVDIFNYNSLMDYLHKHPNTPFFSKLDDSLWDLVRYDRENMALIKQFINDMPRSRHLSEAKNIESEFSDWERVRRNPKLESVYNYWNRHFTGAFGKEADNLLKKLKNERLQEIKKDMGNKKYLDYENIINEGIITKDDMIAAGIITENSIEKLKNINENDRVIDLSKPDYECPSKCTDVFFFGVPSSGKSCVIMGLLNAPNLEWNHIMYGARYGGKLKTLCRAGITPGQTKGDFASLITGTISDSNNKEIKHHVNIIDMAGEGFTKKISDNPDDKVCFADMGEGIPKMLLNDNEKVFFIIIDPTSEKATLRYKDIGGSTSLVTVFQEETLLRFLSLFDNPPSDDKNVNSHVLQNVKAIHIIVTKSDCLEKDKPKRDQMAEDIINAKYPQVKQKLISICDENSINLSTNCRPHLFTFSLGSFYYGGIFEYDYTDSNKILDAIACMSSGKRKKRWFEMLKDWFNN